MGYTNYWTPNKDKIRQTAEFPQELLNKIHEVASAFNRGVMIEKKIKGPIIGIRLEKDSISITGACEGFEFGLCKDSHTGDRIGVDSWMFCKTNRESYDAVIKCVLMLLTSYGLLLSWDHDDNGNCTEHRKAVALAKKCDIPIVHNYYPASDVAK